MSLDPDTVRVTEMSIPALRDILKFVEICCHKEMAPQFVVLSRVFDELADLRQLRITNDELRRQLAEAEAKHERCHAELTKRREQVVALGGEL